MPQSNRALHFYQTNKRTILTVYFGMKINANLVLHPPCSSTNLILHPPWSSTLANTKTTRWILVAPLILQMPHYKFYKYKLTESEIQVLIS